MSQTTDHTPQTKTDSYRAIKDAGEDEPLRKRVAAAIASEPGTTSELADRFPERSANAIRPRVNELLRMGCVERSGKTTNPSGHEAYLHHITSTGEAYLRGECDPEPRPTLSELQGDVVDVARSFVSGSTNQERLAEVLKSHDGAKIRRDPDWSPPHILESVATDGGETGGLSEAEREQIESDPYLSLSDFRGNELEYLEGSDDE